MKQMELGHSIRLPSQSLTNMYNGVNTMVERHSN